MIKLGSKIHTEIMEYTLSDYEFLEDYEIIDSNPADKYTFSAQIKNSTQKVRFIKKSFSEQLFCRFKVLSKLYKSGIVLADNMFIIEECDQFYFYIIQAELEASNPRFRSLQHYLYHEQPSQDERKAIVSKIKILLDCLHQEGQPYGGLDVMNIIVDEERHIYLAPFQLEPQLRTDIFSTAYYPPEILSKIQEQSCEIDESAMMSWDFWSFGCIACEVLLYNSPLFLETSLKKQIQKIKQFAWTTELEPLEQLIRNVIMNSLNKDPLQRNTSPTQFVITKDGNQNDLKRTVKNWKKNIQKGSEEVIELNIWKDNQMGDSELTLTFWSLQNMQIKEELHLIVFLDKKYHFYIDYSSETSRYKVNKMVTIRKDFSQISKLLEEPVRVEAKEGSSSTTILIHLQSLVIMYQGRRLWTKELLGTYKSSKGSNSPAAKLKVSCLLTSPDFFVEEAPVIKPKVQQTEAPFNETQSLSPQILAEVTNLTPKIKKKKEKVAKNNDIPSISQISKSISCITESFMKKLSCKAHQNQFDPVLKETS